MTLVAVQKFSKYLSVNLTGDSGASTGSITPTGNGTVQLGSTTKRFSQAYFTNADFTGNVTFGAGVQNLGTKPLLKITQVILQPQVTL